MKDLRDQQDQGGTQETREREGSRDQREPRAPGGSLANQEHPDEGVCLEILVGMVYLEFLDKMGGKG